MKTKSTLRAEARNRRASLARENRDFAERVAHHARDLAIPDQSVVGAFVALADEADPHLLVERLAERSCRIAFPRVVARGEPLVFHLWRAGDALTPGAYGVLEPLAHWPDASPTVVLVPMLAFDERGYRLGYGGGFYDRTLAALRKKGAVRTIGVAYAGQEIDALPAEFHDQRLDMVVTERGLRRFS